MKTPTTKQQLRALYAEVCITLHRENDYECEDTIRASLERLKEETKGKDLAEKEIKKIKEKIRDMLEELNKQGVNTREILRSHDFSHKDLAEQGL